MKKISSTWERSSAEGVSAGRDTRFCGFEIEMKENLEQERESMTTFSIRSLTRRICWRGTMRTLNLKSQPQRLELRWGSVRKAGYAEKLKISGDLRRFAVAGDKDKTRLVLLTNI